MLGSLAFSLYNYFACRPLVGRSVLRGRGRFGPLGLHALFSVLQGAKAPFPCRGVGQRPTSQSANQLISQSAGRQRRPFGLIAAKGGGPGFNLCGSSKPPHFYASIVRPAGGSRPLIGSNLRNRRFPILAVLVEVWKLRGLEAWLSQRPCPSCACRAFSVLRSPFSVLRGASAPLPISHPGFSRKTQRRKGWAR